MNTKIRGTVSAAVACLKSTANIYLPKGDKVISQSFSFDAMHECPGCKSPRQVAVSYWKTRTGLTGNAAVVICEQCDTK